MLNWYERVGQFNIFNEWLVSKMIKCVYNKFETWSWFELKIFNIYLFYLWSEIHYYVNKAYAKIYFITKWGVTNTRNCLLLIVFMINLLMEWILWIRWFFPIHNLCKQKQGTNLFITKNCNLYFSCFSTPSFSWTSPLQESKMSLLDLIHTQELWTFYLT